MFLTPAELEQLTGARRASAQVRWLVAKRIRHYVNAHGQPVVARAWLIGERDTAPPPQRPNFAVLQGGK